MMKKAFSMIELIFVIVLIGVLASIGGNLMPDNRLLKDTSYMTMKIKETQKNAIAYDVVEFGAPWSSDNDNNTTCIDLNIDGFLEKEENRQKPHRFSIKNDFDEGVLCFDSYGRPYQEEQLLLQEKDINVTYNGKSKIISVLPISGYVTISR